MTTLETLLRQAKRAKGEVALLDEARRNALLHAMAAALRGNVDAILAANAKDIENATGKIAHVMVDRLRLSAPRIEDMAAGICHIYVDKAADLDMAVSILYNAKTSRPSVCNAAEVCLVHSGVAGEFLPRAKQKLDEKNVELRLDDRAAALTEGTKAGPDDFDTEFNDYILAVAVVDNVDDAIAHINAHSTGHSDAIITKDPAAAAAFLQQVDSAAVYHNASTRYTDGGEFGLGCEMGISTQKIGARGPMGLYELTSYKYIIEGDGQVR